MWYIDCFWFDFGFGLGFLISEGQEREVSGGRNETAHVTMNQSNVKESLRPSGLSWALGVLGVLDVVDLQLQLHDADVSLVEKLPQPADLLLLLVELQPQL